MTPTHLTAHERETVILLSDGDDVARISTHQPRILTKLRNNPAAREVEDLAVGSSAGASFEMPARLITFRSVDRKGGPGNPEALAEHRRKAAA